MTEIHYEIREKDLIAFNEHILGSNERIQKVLRRHQAIIPGVIAILALILFFYLKDIPSSIYVILLAGAWGGGVPLFLKWSMRRQLRQMYSAEEKAGIMGHYTLKAEPVGLLEVDSKGESSTLEWKNVLRVEVEKKYVFVFIALDSALIIPRDTLTKDSNLKEFVKAVVDNID